MFNSATFTAGFQGKEDALPTVNQSFIFFFLPRKMNVTRNLLGREGEELEEAAYQRKFREHNEKLMHGESLDLKKKWLPGQGSNLRHGD